jgi:hypothetical protein
MRVALSECASPSRALRGSSTHGRSLAAVRIQARCRGLLVRARLRLRRHALESAAAVRIQRHWRGHAERNSLNAALRKVDAAFESAQLAACGPELASSSTMLASPHPLGFGIPLPEGHSGQWHARSKVRGAALGSLVDEARFLKPRSPTASYATSDATSEASSAPPPPYAAAAAPAGPRPGAAMGMPLPPMARTSTPTSMPHGMLPPPTPRGGGGAR